MVGQGTALMMLWKRSIASLSLPLSLSLSLSIPVPYRLCHECIAGKGDSSNPPGLLERGFYGDPEPAPDMVRANRISKASRNQLQRGGPILLRLYLQDP